MKSKRRMRQAQRQKKKLLTTISLSGLALVVVGLVAYTLLTASRPAPGEAVEIMPDTRHVPEGTDPGPYNTDPPTSGLHYESTLDPGFYEEGQVQSAYPAGQLVHNLEHGYVIFWYNCDGLDEQACSRLKEQIRGVMEQENFNKVIAFPWPTIEEPVVLTSWGRIQRFENFNPGEARDFVQRNRNKAPEPNAP